MDVIDIWNVLRLVRLVPRWVVCQLDFKIEMGKKQMGSD